MYFSYKYQLSFFEFSYFVIRIWYIALNYKILSSYSFFFSAKHLKSFKPIHIVRDTFCGNTIKSIHPFLQIVELNEVVNLIGNVGFPVAISAYLLIRLEKNITSLTSSINKLNTIISTKLGIVIDNGNDDNVA